MKKLFLSLAVLSFVAVACEGLLPINNPDNPNNPGQQETPTALFGNELEDYQIFIDSTYLALRLPAYSIPVSDPGMDFGRLLWVLGELPTDESWCVWADMAYIGLSDDTWDADNDALLFMWSKLYDELIPRSMTFLQCTEPELLEAAGCDNSTMDAIDQLRGHAWFLQGYAYSIALDLWGNAARCMNTTEQPVMATAEEVAEYALMCLYQASQLLPETGNGVGSALASEALSARICMQMGRWNDALDHAMRVIQSGRYSLDNDYAALFCTNNCQSPELLFSLPYRVEDECWGGTTFLVHASVGYQEEAEMVGSNGGWGGVITSREYVQRFFGVDSWDYMAGTYTTLDNDVRSTFFFNKYRQEPLYWDYYMSGWSVHKFRNTGEPTSNFVNIDFPIIRYAEVLLMAAESLMRMGNIQSAQLYVAQVRERANLDVSSQVSLDAILQEWTREFIWEARRRTNLIRFGLFTGGDYMWPWKGGVQDGTVLDESRRYYPIPSQVLANNPNLQQNSGY